jgi:hypothetical protein
MNAGSSSGTPRLAAAHPRDGHGDAALQRLAFGHEPQVAAGHLNGLLGQAGVLVTPQHDFGDVACVRVPGGRHVARAGAVFCNGEVQRQFGLVRAPVLGQRQGRRRRVGLGDVEDQAVGHQPGSAVDDQHAAGQRLAVQLEPAETPRPERQRVQPERQQFLQVTVLHLEVLRVQQHALRPEHPLQLPHRRPLRVGGNVRGARSRRLRTGRVRDTGRRRAAACTGKFRRRTAVTQEAEHAKRGTNRLTNRSWRANLRSSGLRSSSAHRSQTHTSDWSSTWPRAFIASWSASARRASTSPTTSKSVARSR